MNSKTITQLVIVRGDTAEEFQDKFNSTMAALADQNPQFSKQSKNSKRKGVL